MRACAAVRVVVGAGRRCVLFGLAFEGMPMTSRSKPVIGKSLRCFAAVCALTASPGESSPPPSPRHGDRALLSAKILSAPSEIYSFGRAIVVYEFKNLSDYPLVLATQGWPFRLGAGAAPGAVVTAGPPTPFVLDAGERLLGVKFWGWTGLTKAWFGSWRSRRVPRCATKY